MGIVNLKYGNGIVTLNTRGAQSVKKLSAPPVPPLPDLEKAFNITATYQCIASPGLHILIRPTDKITIVIRGPVSSWMRQDQILPVLIRYLAKLGVPLSNMKILIANGLQPALSEEALQALVTPRFYEKVKVAVHDCDTSNLVFLGKSSHGTPIWVNSLLRGRKIILLDGTRGSPVFGYSGGPECLLNACGRATIVACCKQGIGEYGVLPCIAPNTFAKNPITEDAIEISNRIQPLFAVHVLASQGKLTGIFCGRWLEAWYRSCTAFKQAYGTPIPQGTEIIAAACGGSPADATFESVSQTLCNVASVIPEGEPVIFTAECRDGAGSPSFARWMDALENGIFDQILAEEPDTEGILLAQTLKILQTHIILLQTKLHTQSLAYTGTQLFHTMETLETNIPFAGKQVCIITDATECVPYLPENGL